MRNQTFFRRCGLLGIAFVLIVCLLKPTPVFAVGVLAFEFEDTVGQAGQIAEIPIVLQNNPGIATCRFRVTVDSSKVEILSVEKSENLSIGTLDQAVDSANGTATFLWYSVSNFSDNGELARLKVKVISEITEPVPLELRYRADDVLNEDGQPVDYTVSSGRIVPGGKISGVVRGASLDGKEISLNLLESGAVLATASTTQGSYDFSAVPAGNYQIQVLIDGIAKRLVNVEVTNEDISYDISLSLVGDIDGDGEVTDWDAVLLARYLAGWDVEENLVAMDIDGDGEISDWDSVLFDRYLAGWDVEVMIQEP